MLSLHSAHGVQNDRSLTFLDCRLNDTHDILHTQDGQTFRASADVLTAQVHEFLRVSEPCARRISAIELYLRKGVCSKRYTSPHPRKVSSSLTPAVLIVHRGPVHDAAKGKPLWARLPRDKEQVRAMHDWTDDRKTSTIMFGVSSRHFSQHVDGHDITKK